MKNKFTKVLSVILVLACILSGLLWYNRVDVKASERSVSIQTGKNTNQPQIDSYSGVALSVKSLNNYEYSFTGSDSKITLGSGLSTFNNKITFSRWSEASISLSLPNTITGTFGNTQLGSGNKVSVSNSGFIFAYSPTLPKEGFNELGGIDLVITLKRKPTFNIIPFTYSNSSCTGYLQPPLTAEYSVGLQPDGTIVSAVNDTDVLDDKGNIIAHRPDYVINSIAWYIIGKAGNYLAFPSGKDYKTGKIGNLYRPKATDALGKSVWADWSLSGNLVNLTIPQKFLDTAAYPITIAPAGDYFGYTSKGTAGQIGFGINITATASIVNTHTAVTGDTITGFSMYGNRGLVDHKMAVAAYTYESGHPTTRLSAKVDILVSTPDTLYSIGSLSQALSNGVAYCVAWSGEDSGIPSPAFYVDYDSGSAPGRFTSASFTLDATFGYVNTDSGSHYSVYATFTPGSSYSITNTPTVKAFGAIKSSSTYYAKEAPANPVVDANCTFTMTNDSAVAEKVQITGTDFTGGTTQTLTAGSPGANTLRITAYYSGENYSPGTVLTTSPQDFYASLAASSTLKWDFKLELGTPGDENSAKSGTITFTAVAP